MMGITIPDGSFTDPLFGPWRRLQLPDPHARWFVRPALDDEGPPSDRIVSELVALEDNEDPVGGGNDAELGCWSSQGEIGMPGAESHQSERKALGKRLPMSQGSTPDGTFDDPLFGPWRQLELPSAKAEQFLREVLGEEELRADRILVELCAVGDGEYVHRNEPPRLGLQGNRRALLTWWRSSERGRPRTAARPGRFHLWAKPGLAICVAAACVASAAVGHVLFPSASVQLKTVLSDQVVPPASAPSTSPAGYEETTGGLTDTWSDYLNAGGAEGPNIPPYAAVRISCAVQGFRVADGNTWWYRILSPPWNGAYYASADAFYNNGQVSGSLRGTPFVDANVPKC
jgi:hypothetical protein